MVTKGFLSSSVRRLLKTFHLYLYSYFFSSSSSMPPSRPPFFFLPHISFPSLYSITNISRPPVHRPPSTFFFFFPSFVSPTISPSTLYNIFWGNFLTFYLGQHSTACLSCQKLANSPPTISFHIVQHHQLGNFLTFNLGSCQKNWPTHHRSSNHSTIIYPSTHHMHHEHITL